MAPLGKKKEVDHSACRQRLKRDGTQIYIAEYVFRLNGRVYLIRQGVGVSCEGVSSFDYWQQIIADQRAAISKYVDQNLKMSLQSG